MNRTVVKKVTVGVPDNTNQTQIDLRSVVVDRNPTPSFMGNDSSFLVVYDPVNENFNVTQTIVINGGNF